MTATLVKILIGLAIVVAIGVSAIHVGGGARALEEKIRTASLRAAQHADWAEIDTVGQRIVVSGVAPSRAEAETLIARLQTAVSLGGVAGVTSKIKIAPPPERVRIATATDEPPETTQDEPPQPVETSAEIVIDPEITRQACDEAVQATLAANPVRFEFGQRGLSDANEAALDALVEALSACNGVEIVIEGHTDTSGGALANVRMSRLRADSVAAFLAARLPNDIPIFTSGFGDARPVASNDTREGRAQNRRIEITVLSKVTED